MPREFCACARTPLIPPGMCANALPGRGIVRVRTERGLVLAEDFVTGANLWRGERVPKFSIPMKRVA
jgi:hypothetical protein